MKIAADQRTAARALKGKTIAAVHLCDVGLSNVGDCKASEPIIVFADGTTLRLCVTETDEGNAYGVDLVYPARDYNGD